MITGGVGLLTAGGIGAALTAAFSQVKSFIQKIRGLIIGIAYFKVSDLASVTWMMSQKEFDWGDRHYGVYEDYANGRKISSSYFSLEGKTHVRFVPAPIIISKSDHGLKIIYLKWTLNPDKLMNALFSFEKTFTETGEESRTCSSIYNINGSLGNRNNRPNQDSPVNGLSSKQAVVPSFVGQDWGEEISRKFNKELGSFMLSEGNTQSFDGLFYENDVLDSIKSLEMWLKLQKWYAQKRIPWKRGILLYGKPGTGKSSLARAIGEKYSLDIYTFRLSTFSDSEFQDRVFECLGRTPRIFLFEDADIPLELRKSNTSHMGETPLTLSTFLNTIDGVKPLNNVFVIVTTNCIEKLDNALLRPGRLDEKIELKTLSPEGKKKVAEFILGEWPEDAGKFASVKEDLTGAEFKEICIKHALQKKWEIHPSSIDTFKDK